ncbi:hypothetical protein [Cerasicoccus fimbriatus]|uniref:hypothetical protein n=1 Tax=Cerasicoccus fimbriatus TaxID=3014554 RepID=UPI0022B52910|nr:hypothetical protein [Cerasicoccus sp. TK19100]
MTTKISFKDGYADGYEFAIPENFKESLTREKFSVGDVFYNDRSAYESPWNEALRKFTVCLQVVQSLPNSIRFKVLRPNGEKNALETLEIDSVKVDKFHEILKSGLR